MSELLEEMKLLNEDHAQDGYPAVKMCEINGLIEIIEKKSEQLAKANERVAELEDKHLNLVLWHNLDQQQAKLYSNKYANKFAIEQKFDLLSEMVSSTSDYLFNHDKLDIRSNCLGMLLKNFCNYHREQLRKEQV